MSVAICSYGANGKVVYILTNTLLPSNVSNTVCMEYESIRCKDCGGVAHPASGCVYSPTYIVCGPCTRKAWEWIRSHTSGKGRRKGPSFYDHVNVISPILPSNVDK